MKITVLTIKTIDVINQYNEKVSFINVGYYNDAFALQADIDWIVHDVLKHNQELFTQEIELNKYYGL